MESADRISPTIAYASEIDSYVLPTAVGPVNTTNGLFIDCVTDIILLPYTLSIIILGAVCRVNGDD